MLRIDDGKRKNEKNLNRSRMAKPFLVIAATGVATDQPYHVNEDGPQHLYRQGNLNALMEKSQLFCSWWRAP